MPIIIGHRGAGKYAPENTLKSFQTAIDINCDRAELDVRMTKDNKVIVIHDKEIPGLGFVKDLTLDEIKKINIDKTEKIPTLQEVINVCKNKIDLQIELKADNTPKAVNQHILQNKIEKQVVITSFKDYLLKEIKNLNPALRVGLLIYKDEVFKKVWNLVTEIPLDFLGFDYKLITKEVVDKAHSLDKTVYAYGINDKKIGNQLIQIGIDEIGTDYPKLFIN